MIRPLKIVLNDYAGHAFTADLARGLARRGHDVTYTYFAASTETPKGDVDRLPDDPDTLNIRGVEGGGHLIKGSFRKRREQDHRFATTVAAIIEEAVPDLVLSACAPPEINLILVKASRRVGTRFVNWVQDIWSIAARVAFRERAPITAHAAAFVLERMERRLVRQSDANIVICDAFRDLALGWGADPARLTVMPNWGLIESMPLRPKVNDWSREHGLHDKTCLIYSGTLGLKHNPGILAELATALRDRREVRVVVVSEGEEARKLAELKMRRGLENLAMLPFQPFARYADVVATADILIGLLDADAGDYCVPSKVLAYLCAGRALLLAMPQANLAAQVVEEAGAGLVVAPGDVDGFVARAKDLVEQAETRANMGAAGREYAERTFSRDVVISKIEAVLDRVMADMARPCYRSSSRFRLST